MNVTLNPYLSFRDNARAALEFYHSVFGGQLTIMTFGEAHASDDPADADKVMHGQLEGEQGVTLMASDTPDSMELPSGPSSISVSLSGDDEATLTSYWEQLSAEGTATVPLAKAGWGDTFGMCTDKFGVGWMVNIAGRPTS